MVVLRRHAPGRLGQSDIGFQGIVKHLDLPPFLVAYRHGIAITR